MKDEPLLYPVFRLSTDARVWYGSALVGAPPDFVYFDELGVGQA